MGRQGPTPVPDLSSIPPHTPETDPNRCCHSPSLGGCEIIAERDMIPIAKGLIIWFLYNQHFAH